MTYWLVFGALVSFVVFRALRDSLQKRGHKAWSPLLGVAVLIAGAATGVDPLLLLGALLWLAGELWILLG